MLKTNSKKAVENLKKYIIRNFDATDYPQYKDANEHDFTAVAKVIYDCFLCEKYYTEEYAKWRGITTQDLFIDWAQGLPSILNTCYYYNRSAVDDLGAILEETETEKLKYTESEAERLLTRLIFLHISKAAGN